MGLFEDSLQKLKARLTNIEISAATIMKVLRFSMEIVETTQLKGEAQMELCKKMIRTGRRRSSYFRCQGKIIIGYD